MASTMDMPISPMSAHGYPSVPSDTSKLDLTHLSGMTMAEFTKEPQIHFIDASPVASKRSSKLQSKRSSIATTSTTKSQLRQTNHILVEMLQNIQTELVAHRTIMLDIQRRVSHLEHESNASIANDAPLAALQVLEGKNNPSRRSSKLVGPEGLFWWQACQNFARNAEPPISAREFLRTPRPTSGIDWQYGAKPSTPPATPPDVEDLPPLTPTSEEGDSYVDTPTRHDILLGEEILTSTPKMKGVETGTDSDIIEHTIVVDKKLPAPPVLQPPPGAKPVIVGNENVAQPIVPEIAENPSRYYKGVRSLATYKALLKHKTTDKEHHVLIHFHRRTDLKDVE